jgi:hypothetical protein
VTTRPVGRPFVSTLSLAAVVVLATRWPFRSHALFSWDSANFALAMARIDIAAHRPHPPGYLGYVLAARALDLVFHDPNTSFVVWNLIVTALAAALLVRWAWELGEGQPHQALLPAATAAMFLSGPLLWFYGEVAEIYPSELLVSLLVAYAAWRVIRGTASAIVWCAVALAAAAIFKVTAAILIFPLAAYAWTRAPRPLRVPAVAIGAALLAVVAATFLILEPDILSIVWRQFATSTASTRVVGGTTSVFRALNLNARDTFTAAVSALGFVNLAALFAWIVIDRRLPAGLTRPVALLWAVPWLALVLAIHIGRRGYVLPLVPVAALVLASFYARQRRNVAIALVTVQLVANAAQFIWLEPLPAAMVGDALYKDKPLAERIASDLDAVTFPTATTIAASDQRAAALAALVDSVCPSRDPIIVGEEDWRRVLLYFPSATAINTSGDRVLYVGRETNFAGVPANGTTFVTSCPAIWLAGDDHRATQLTPQDARPAQGVGATTDPGTYAVTTASIARVR